MKVVLINDYNIYIYYINNYKLNKNQLNHISLIELNIHSPLDKDTFIFHVILTSFNYLQFKMIHDYICFSN